MSPDDVSRAGSPCTCASGTVTFAGPGVGGREVVSISTSARRLRHLVDYLPVTPSVSVWECHLIGAQIGAVEEGSRSPALG